MKKLVLTAAMALAAAFNAAAQTAADTIPVVPVATLVAGQTAAQPGQAPAAPQPKYGAVSYDALLKAMPEYAEVQRQLDGLRKKYEEEAAYNERVFKRMFGEFLQGQKDFPQNILLKRQRDLQDEMEKGLAFRREADSLLVRAEQNMLVPVRQRLEQAIRLVGLEKGYEFIINTDLNAYPYVHATLIEDANEAVRAKLK